MPTFVHGKSSKVYLDEFEMSGYLNSTRYLLADPVQSPFALERDSHDRMLHVVNFLVTREVS